MIMYHTQSLCLGVILVKFIEYNPKLVKSMIAWSYTTFIPNRQRTQDTCSDDSMFSREILCTYLSIQNASISALFAEWSNKLINSMLIYS